VTFVKGRLNFEIIIIIIIIIKTTRAFGVLLQKTRYINSLLFYFNNIITHVLEKESSSADLAITFGLGLSGAAVRSAVFAFIQTHA